jgi:hypothetical protein
MLGGTDTAAMDDDSDTVEPPAGAEDERVTVQAVCAPDARLEGEQTSPVTLTTG